MSKGRTNRTKHDEIFHKEWNEFHAEWERNPRTVAEYNAGCSAIENSERDRRKAASAAMLSVSAAPAGGGTQKAPYVMTAEDRAALEAFQKRLDADDVEDIVAIAQDKAYVSLLLKSHRELQAELSGDRYARFVGAQLSLAALSLRAQSARSRRLEAHIAKLQARPEMKYCGTFEDGTHYTPGNFVTHSGCVWYCREATRERPGTSRCWQLAVKRGSDGKDAR